MEREWIREHLTMTQARVNRPWILFNLKSMSLSHILVLRSSKKEFLLLGELSEVVRSSKELLGSRKLRSY